MVEPKTKKTKASVKEFISAITDSEQKKKDSFDLVELLETITGSEAEMWGSSIIGFGQYHYKSEKSRQEGDWPLLGFSPRKSAISLYIYSNTADQDALLLKLGKFTMGKACIYIKKLSDINIDIFKEIVFSTIKYLKTKYED